ncbi:MAG: phosphoglycerate dehydrogenase, partial [Gammaproteobacteria bacterium]
MTKPRVLISDSMSSQAVTIFEERGIDVVASSKLSEAELLDTIGDFDGLAIRSSTNVTAELLERATRLKVVGRAGIGVDNVDVAACTKRGVVVMNTPLGNAITTAEHAMAMMLALARHIPQANSSTRAGKWEKSRFMGVELTGKLLGLIGAGNIGSIVARKAIGYGLHVQAYDPFLTEERADKLGIKKVELDELLSASDIISLHVPKTPETSNIISATAINRMKKGSILINCARGGLVDELALKAALESGHLKGAALDVYEVEPARENPLFELDNVICTPHLGASTIEAQEKVAIQIAEQISDYLLTGAVNNAINAPSISAEEAQLLRPYLQLAQCLGSFVGQLTHDPI